jgi:hypothetical protein
MFPAAFGTVATSHLAACSILTRTDASMGRVERDREIARRRTRRAKLKKLRARFAKATDQATKNLILAKVRRISPFAVLEQPAE